MSMEELRGQLAALVAANAIVEERIKGILELARTMDVDDREAAGRSWMRRRWWVGVSRPGMVS